MFGGKACLISYLRFQPFFLCSAIFLLLYFLHYQETEAGFRYWPGKDSSLESVLENSDIAAVPMTKAFPQEQCYLMQCNEPLLHWQAQQGIWPAVNMLAMKYCSCSFLNVYTERGFVLLPLRRSMTHQQGRRITEKNAEGSAAPDRH